MRSSPRAAGAGEEHLRGMDVPLGDLLVGSMASRSSTTAFE
jgi:hypothetical protein